MNVHVKQDDKLTNLQSIVLKINCLYVRKNRSLSC